MYGISSEPIARPEIMPPWNPKTMIETPWVRLLGDTVIRI